jgi:glycosyltransferase involved in cell wall biosynthesis
MKNIKAVPIKTESIGNFEQHRKSFVSVVVSAYNEAPILTKNLSRLCEYMTSLEDKYRWEMIIVNDGSADKTGDLAESFAKTRDNVHVLHHMYNFRLGQALRFAFNNCQGDYVVVMDLDLSYSPDHIGKLLAKIKETRAKIVIASPYMKGGKVSNVPWLRRTLSIWANRFLSFTAKSNLSTLTSMVRAYDGMFLNTLNLKSMDMEINAEIIYKAEVLRARIVEIPGHLDWGFQKTDGIKRRSSMRIFKSIMSYLFSGFIFRPFIFFMLPGLVLMLFSIYTLIHVVKYTFVNFQSLPASFGSVDYRLGAAVAAAFNMSPHAFIVGGISLMVAIQLISLGILSTQVKRYFEELFHISTTIYKHKKENHERQ